MTRLEKTRLTLAALLASSALGAQAQWSADPAANLIVGDTAGGTTQPKIAATPDGGFYVSWLDNIAAGFDVHLQRLDAGGNAQWAHDGVVVADRGYGFTYDYGLATDAAGNAYVAFNCCENASAAEHISVSKVAPDGSLAWGVAGVTVSTAAEAVYNAYVTALADGSVVVAWSADSGVRAQKLDAGGQAQWADGGVLIDQPAGFKLLGGVQPAPNGDVVVSWSNQAGPARILTAQKLAAADGAPLWNGGTGVRVFGQGNLQAGYYPPFVADGAGGGVFWDYDLVGVKWNARVQHVDAAGNLLLGSDGVLATTDATMDHVGTSAAYDAASGDIYVVWVDTYDQDLQSYDGVSAQRIDASGNRAWGDAGKVLVAPALSTDGTHSISQLTALATPGGVLAGWVTGAVPAPDQPLTVAALDATGAYRWPAQTVDVKTTRYTGGAVGAVGANGFAVYAWKDGDGDAGLSTIRAQNLNLDGTLGPAVVDRIFADGFELR
jgi:hypothetical protein